MMPPKARADLIAVIREWWHEPGYVVDFDHLVDMLEERYEIEPK